MHNYTMALETASQIKTRQGNGKRDSAVKKVNITGWIAISETAGKEILNKPAG